MKCNYIIESVWNSTGIHPIYCEDERVIGSEYCKKHLEMVEKGKIKRLILHGNEERG